MLTIYPILHTVEPILHTVHPFLHADEPFLDTVEPLVDSRADGRQVTLGRHLVRSMLGKMCHQRFRILVPEHAFEFRLQGVPGRLHRRHDANLSGKAGRFSPLVAVS